MADAIVKGINMDKHVAYAAIIEDAYEVSLPYDSKSGRRKGLRSYKELGYIPTGAAIATGVV